ncbi:MAG: hypothetical protein LBR23_00650 [Spirochaetaceae bacterium]|jgi:hypothetical protein|nr:hypothetical protein [Spirochaetaceae bacterium]
MKFNKRKAILIASGFLFFLLYVVFAARPLSEALHLEPAWTIDIAEAEVQPAAGKELLPYKLGHTLGYFTPEGAIVSRVTFPFAASISSSYWAAFLPDASRTVFYTSDGREAGVIGGSGFPFFDEDRAFLFSPGGAAVSRISGTGQILWTNEGYAPITSFESTPNGAVAGYADGIIRLFSPEGAVHEVEPGGSGFPVILGAALSPDARMVASVSGIQGQRFILTRVEGEVNKVVSHRYLERETNEQVLVKFNAGGTCVYYNPLGALCVYDCLRGTTTEIPVDGAVIDVQEVPGGPFAFGLSKSGITYTVWILEKMSKVVGSFSFEADSAFIRTSPGALYVGKNSTIAKINVSRR